MNGTDISPGDDTHFLGTAIDKLRKDGAIGETNTVCPYDAIILNAPDGALPRMRDSFCKRHRERWPGGDEVSDIREWLLRKSREQWRAEKLAESVVVNIPDEVPMSEAQEIAACDAVERRDKFFAEHTNVNCTDYGNTDRFISQHGLDVKYCSAFTSWYIWTPEEGRWKKDAVGQISEMSKKTIRRLYTEAEGMRDDAMRKNLARWALNCETTTHTAAILTLAQSDPWIRSTPDMFDTDPMLLNMKNGVYDLAKHCLLPHEKDRLITRSTKLAYDEEAPCPKWLAFLDRIFLNRADKKEMIEFIQRAAGYSLTGKTNEQVLFLLHGQGQNGKSILLNTILGLMGEYGYSAESASFTTARSDKVRNDLAAWAGMRFIKASEQTKTAMLDEQLIKQLTGSEQVTARFLFQENFTYEPTFKLWLGFNHRPDVRDNTFSIWRRILLIPFEEIIPDDEVDLDLQEKINKELPGVFNWVVEGLKCYQATGLKPPASVTAATQEYRQDSDILFDFLNEMCEDGPYKTPSGELYHAYREWCVFNHYLDKNIMSQAKFGREMSERYKKDRKNKHIVYHGIQVIPGKIDGLIKDREGARYGKNYEKV